MTDIQNVDAGNKVDLVPCDFSNKTILQLMNRFSF